MGGACGTYERRRRHIEFLFENLKQRGQLEYVGVDETIILDCK
jgi:hypothetical protein